MSKTLSKSLASLCLIGAAVFMAGPAAAEAPEAGKGRALFLEDTSPADMFKTLDTFRSEVKAAGWNIANEHNMAGLLSARGYTLHPDFVLEICNHKFGAQLLAKDETRYLSSMMPCRVAIYQTSAGKVVISRINASGFASMLDGDALDVMMKANNEVEAIIKKTLDKLK